jgi:acyl dehydratase
MDPLRNADVSLVGRTARWRRRVTQADFDRFARISGDDNPIHVDVAFAARTRFGRTLAHGMMLYGFVVALVRQELVPGGVEVDGELVFPGPVFAGDLVSIDAEIVRVDVAAGRVEVRACVRRDGGGYDGDSRGCEARGLWQTDV